MRKAAFILAVVLGLSLSSCTNQPTSSKETFSTMSTGSGSKTIERTTTASATAETTGSTGAPQTDGTQTTVLSAERSTTTSRTTTTTEASVKWDGPAGYTIVVPAAAEREVLQAAERLKAFYAQKYQVDLPIVKDSQKETDKEILIGKTNRSQSNKSLDDNVYAVSVKGKKLVFDLGHYVAAHRAITQFIANSTATGNIMPYQKTFDFGTKMLEKYVYVWGDEFDSDSLDDLKWHFGTDMGPRPDLVLMNDENPDYVKVADGYLQMSARRYFSPVEPMVRYATAQTVSTQETMNYKYGYLVMRAKLPYKQGAWPSFWMKSTGKLAPRKTTDYFAEVDILEVFSSVHTLSPNLHKWYANGTHTQYPGGKKESYRFENYYNLNEEYHLYGFEWTPEKMTMSIDGVDYMTFDLSYDFDEGGNMDGFHDCMYFMMSNHLFTEHGAYIPNPEAIANDYTKFPIEYCVDWVRLYQEPGVGELHTKQG